MIMTPQDTFRLILNCFVKFKYLIHPQALLGSGASAHHMNTQLYSAPIHVAAEDVNLDNIRLLLENTKNKADVNSNNKLGLTAIHILLGKLVEFAAWQNKAKNIRPNKVCYESFSPLNKF